MILTLTRDLVAGSPSDLVIANDPTDDYWISELTEPDFDNRETFADLSAHVAGDLLTQSVKAAGVLATTIYTQASTAAGLKANKRALEDAVAQFRLTVTLDLVGAADSYAARRGRLSWGDSDSGMVAALLARAVVTIPVQPLEA